MDRRHRQAAALSGLAVAGCAACGATRSAAGYLYLATGLGGPGASGPEEGKYLGSFLGIASSRVMTIHLRSPRRGLVPSDGAIGLRIREDQG